MCYKNRYSEYHEIGYMFERECHGITKSAIDKTIIEQKKYLTYEQNQKVSNPPSWRCNGI